VFFYDPEARFGLTVEKDRDADRADGGRSNTAAGEAATNPTAGTCATSSKRRFVMPLRYA